MEMKDIKKNIKNAQPPCSLLYRNVHAINKTIANMIKQNTDHVLSNAIKPLKGKGIFTGIEVKGKRNIPIKKMASITLSIL